MSPNRYWFLEEKVALKEFARRYEADLFFNRTW
jgi:hypothetical protein